MSRYLSEWSLAIEYEPISEIAIRFRNFPTERAARKAFRKEYEKNDKVRKVHLYAPADKGREPEALK